MNYVPKFKRRKATQHIKGVGTAVNGVEVESKQIMFSLRFVMKPTDALILGEIRGEEAKEMLHALYGGSSFTSPTTHATGAQIKLQ